MIADEEEQMFPSTKITLAPTMPDIKRPPRRWFCHHHHGSERSAPSLEAAAPGCRLGVSCATALPGSVYLPSL